jgi:hypothetical protein
MPSGCCGPTDHLLIAEIWGEGRRRARWLELSSDEEAAAVAAPREFAGSGDLLAKVAGILEGASEGELDEPLAARPPVCAAQPGPPESSRRRRMIAKSSECKL